MAEIVNGCGRCGAPDLSMYIGGYPYAVCPRCLFELIEQEDIVLGRRECDYCDQDATHCDDCSTSECENCSNTAMYCDECSGSSMCENCGDYPAMYCDGCYSAAYNEGQNDAPSGCFICDTTSEDLACFECARNHWFDEYHHYEDCEAECDHECEACGRQVYDVYCEECEYCNGCDTFVRGKQLYCEDCAREKFGRSSDTSNIGVISDDGTTFEFDGMTIRWEE